MRKTRQQPLPQVTQKTKKSSMIRIRCQPSTKLEFERFALEWSLKNGEEALLYLLRKTREFEPCPPHGKML
jgi:hypothetical protein